MPAATTEPFRSRSPRCFLDGVASQGMKSPFDEAGLSGRRGAARPATPLFCCSVSRLPCAHVRLPVPQCPAVRCPVVPVARLLSVQCRGCPVAGLPGCRVAQCRGCPVAGLPVVRLPIAPAAHRPGCPALRLSCAPVVLRSGCPMSGVRLPGCPVPSAWLLSAQYRVAQLPGCSASPGCPVPGCPVLQSPAVRLPRCPAACFRGPFSLPSMS